MGRPRGFEAPVALRAALHVFWRQGYAATSLDDLTAAMGLSRSSFYGAFGSKHDVLLAAVTFYVDGIFAEFKAIAASDRSPADALCAILGAMARPDNGPGGGDQGCLLVNSVAELAPDDEAVCEIARRRVGRVLDLIEALLVRAGHGLGTAAPLAGTLLSCTFGLTTLRKAGFPDDALASFLAQAEQLAVLLPE